jgi:IclR family pca regulon transcriptional regulator
VSQNSNRGSVYAQDAAVSTRGRPTPPTEDGATWGALARGMLVLRTLARARRELGLSELSQRTGIDKSTTHRLARVLLDLGYLAQNHDTRKYQLGLGVLELGFGYLMSSNVREWTKPHLEALSREFGGTISLAILDGTDIIYVERLVDPNWTFSFSVDMYVGARLAAHRGALGKALLSCLSDDEVRARYRDRPLEAFTPKTIVDPERLLAEVRETRARGFALNDEEGVPGFRTIAAPIRDRKGDPAGAINVAMISAEWSLQDLVDRISPRLIDVTSTISAQLGYDPDALA